jgi:hypothetical protein
MCSGQVAATSCTLRCCSSHSLCTATTLIRSQQTTLSPGSNLR